MRGYPRSTVVASVLLVAVVVATACSGAGTGPAPEVLLASDAEISELLPLSVEHRALRTGEHVPSVSVTPGRRALGVAVSRIAFCLTQASAAFARAAGELTVVARVSSHPAALCSPNSGDWIVDYSGTIESLTAGRYRVFVYEGIADGRPKLLWAGSVTVPSD